VERKNPRWDLEEEDDAAEIADNEGIRVLPGEPVYFFISNLSWAFMNYRSNQSYGL
jgi:hypothetical protein